MDFYRHVQNRYGLPLDNRATYTKLDWILWTATLTQDQEDFRALVDPVVAFLNQTPDRVPMTDWYYTDTARRRGFTAPRRRRRVSPVALRSPRLAQVRCA